MLTWSKRSDAESYHVERLQRNVISFSDFELPGRAQGACQRSSSFLAWVVHIKSCWIQQHKHLHSLIQNRKSGGWTGVSSPVWLQFGASSPAQIYDFYTGTISNTNQNKFGASWDTFVFMCHFWPSLCSSTLSTSRHLQTLYACIMCHLWIWGWHLKLYSKLQTKRVSFRRQNPPQQLYLIQGKSNTMRAWLRDTPWKRTCLRPSSLWLLPDGFSSKNVTIILLTSPAHFVHATNQFWIQQNA